METTIDQKVSVDKEEYERVNKLVDRLIEDKKEMETEFKQIISAILNEIEAKDKAVVDDGKVSASLQEKIRQQEQTINDLQKRLSKLQNSKLGKLQMKYWELRKRKR
ncbi:hypothetical protein WQ54_27180 [Bacillus sp. SA1-12]|uniref:hypothetical protein n=1 Tax=Bacillus sp. SA1-12 TaxID=1455638 RepID=UPI000626EFEE|nr:hypothetical protein [Bacillus sp. SA1-12]KKI89246.1 hypothetical protein WQ54_27180 [Bacillus sp. SA1-12]